MGGYHQGNRRRIMFALRTTTAFACLSAVFASNAFGSSDTLVTKNGDRLVGTIKKLERGILHFDTDYADEVFRLEWENVQSLSSGTFLVVELLSGERYYGTIRPDSADSGMAVLGGQRRVQYNDMIMIYTVEQSFWDRMDASVDLGYTLTKANNSQQVTAQAGVGYRSENWQAGAKYMAVTNTLADAPKTRKIDASADYRLRIYQRWFGYVGGTYAQSDEQRLDGRYSIGAGAGNYLISTPQNDLLLSLGLNYMAEYFMDPEVPNNSTAEGLVKAEYNGFDLDPLTILARVSVLPNLEDSERVRGNAKVDFKWDLPLDFTFKIGITLDYDSKPPNDAPKSDYVLTTTLGWEL